MNIKMSVNSAMAIAVLGVELMNRLWCSAAPCWARSIAKRQFPTTLVCDIGLVLVLQILLNSTFVRVSIWQDIVKVAVLMTLMFFCLEAPHSINNSNNLSYFFLHSIHKFITIFITLFCIVNYSSLYVLI